MDLNNNNTNKITYTHLSYEERVLIEHLFNNDKLSRGKIAIILGRAKQTINTEIKDGMVKTIKQRQINKNGKIYDYYDESYCAQTGQAKYDNARKNCGRKLKWIDNSDFIDYIDEKILKDKLSPDAAVGQAKKNSLFDDNKIASTSTVYNWIDKGYLKTTNMDLLLKVSRKTKTKRDRKNKKMMGDSIEKRPEIVETREEFGHWEIDTVIGLKTSDDEVLLTLTERKTRFELIYKIASKESYSVDKVMKRLREDLGEKFKEIFKSITADNGSEFSGLSNCLNDIIGIYFSHPYSSWERGTNEKHNGIIRRFIPKGSKITDVPQTNINRIQDWMNNLPRKILGYSTPSEMFMHELKIIA
jgi:IS30 family transposase